MGQASQFRPTAAEINLTALQHNVQSLQVLLSKNTKILAMIKADAYGHGALPIARKLAQLDLAGFGVATVEEGLELRQGGIEKTVVVMGGMLGFGAPASEELVRHNLLPVLHSEQAIDFLETAAAKQNKKVNVHLKIDTGMSRLGVLPKDLNSVLSRLKLAKNISLTGVMTHLACGDDHDFTHRQFELFAKAREKVLEVFGSIPVWHAANSAAILSHQALADFPAQEWWVRPGLALYGIGATALQPVMSLKSHLALIKTIPASSHVSYGATFIAKRATKLGVVPIGYADGYPFRVAHKASVLISGRRVPVLGRVTMDMIMCDLTDLPQVAVGDEVVLLGQQQNESISADELAAWAETIPYEILCGVSKRMPRVYVES